MSTSMKINYLNALFKLSCFLTLLISTACVSVSDVLESDHVFFVRSKSNPIIYPNMAGLEGDLGKNINGPSVIKVPKWVENPLGNYYMYFADHHGKYIRLAYADNPVGPWTIYKSGTLQLSNTAAVGHIASPDVIVDEDSKTIRMYFHGKIPNSSQQKSFVSSSKDGLNFIASKTVLGPSYFRVFEYNRNKYALSFGTFFKYMGEDQLYKKGINILPKARHTAVVVVGDNLVVFYTQKGDAPERILKTVVNMSEGDFDSWKASDPVEILKPEMDYEGANLPIQASESGFARERVHQLRDPAILIDKKDVYLYYSVAGEAGIAVAKLKKSI
ncbi:hypothetical protein [Mariniflexile sp.]|uniref:hypothetical protein n=1 Tax=Mariniflexile sp. TaxID=1979402 RepID=UPI00356A72D4